MGCKALFARLPEEECLSGKHLPPQTPATLELSHMLVLRPIIKVQWLPLTVVQKERNRCINWWIGVDVSTKNWRIECSCLLILMNEAAEGQTSRLLDSGNQYIDILFWFANLLSRDGARALLQPISGQLLQTYRDNLTPDCRIYSHEISREMGTCSLARH